MIGQAKACKGGTALANYVMKPKKGHEVMRNGVCGDTPTEILQQMQPIQDLNQRATNRTFSLVLSPEKKQGQKITDKGWRIVTKEFMQELNIDPEQQQFIAFLHTEKDHKHVHIIASRVDTNGKLLPDHHIGKKAQWAAHKVATKYGMISAKEKQIDNLKEKERAQRQMKGVRKEIKRKHDWVLKQKPRSIKAYAKIMKKMGVEATPVFNKFSKKLQGMRIKDLNTGLDFKASEVHRDMSLNKIMETGIPYETSNYVEKLEIERLISLLPSPSFSKFSKVQSGVDPNGEESKEEQRKRIRRRRGRGR